MDKQITSDTDIEFSRNDFNFKVFAGPGAGKTYFLIKNIISTIKNSEKLKNTNRKILCITYTNVAVNEIKNRLGDYRKYVEVLTIHAFLYEYVIKPYQEQLKYLLKKIYGCNFLKNKKFTPRMEGYGLLSKLKRSDFINTLKEKYKIEIAADVSKKKLSEYVLDLKEINIYPFDDRKNKLSVINNLQLKDEDALKLKRAIWENEAILDFDEILYFSYVLLKEFKFIRYDVQFRFPYVLIDEYQDTNPIQNEMIKIIASNKNVSIGVVGDVAQSIYGFQGARFKEFVEFEINTKEFKEFVINGNRRSNQNIINFLNYIRKADDKLKFQSCIKNTNNTNLITFIKSEESNIDVLNLVDKNAIVLCRRWVDAFKYLSGITKEQNSYLTKLHNYYRYTIDRDLIKDFENDGINWISQIRLIVKLKESIEKKNFENIIYEIEKIFRVDLFNKNVKKHKTTEYKEIQKFIKIFDQFNDDNTYQEIIKKIKSELEKINLPKVYELELPEEGDDNYNYNFNPYLYKLKLKTLKIMVNEIFTEDSKYVTVHRTKGKEYDSVFVNLEPLKDEKESLGSIVKALCDPNILDETSEFIRIAYVAFSRAINNLYIHINSKDENIEQMFVALDKYIADNNLEKFYRIQNLVGCQQ